MSWKRLAFWMVLGVLLLAWAAVLWWPRPRSRPSAPAAGTGPTGPPAAAGPNGSGPRVGATHDAGAGRPDAPKPAGAPAEKGLMARVNGEPIYGEEVLSGINRDMFGMMIKEACRSRLDRLILVVAVRQHLQAQGIAVPEAQVEQEVANLRRNPPAAGCACCRYASLDEFLSANLMTVKDLRDSIRNDLGLNQHVAALWSADYPPGPKRESLRSEQRRRIEQGYQKMSHLFFNTVQQPDYQTNPDEVRQAAKARATAAWQRLQKGEDFAKVAGDCSEDAFSRSKGGSLGCVPKEAFGREVDAAVQQLSPGAYSQPVESPMGFHVVRREAIGDQDILEVLQAEYKDRKLQELYPAIQQHAKVERFDGTAAEK